MSKAVQINDDRECPICEEEIEGEAVSADYPNAVYCSSFCRTRALGIAVRGTEEQQEWLEEQIPVLDLSTQELEFDIDFEEELGI